MFTVEIKINGTMLGHIYGRNLQVQEGGLDRYEYEYYEPEIPKLRCGTVLHGRKNGIRKLVKIILDDVDKKESKIPNIKSNV